MKINKKFNMLTMSECLYLIEQHQKYTDFNTLGLFRGILESTKLSVEQKIILRNQAVAAFGKPFEFLQLKDPITYLALRTLGEELTAADTEKAWRDIRFNQQRIIESKRLNHRNFGIYAKHKCGYANCHLQGLMIRRGSILADGGGMWFCTDQERSGALQNKSEQRRQERKTMKQLIAARLGAE
jgi:hypothetical protein